MWDNSQMTSVPFPARSDATGNLRPLNILRDLPRVADLIELCFANSMDSEGKAYVRQMRRASRDVSFLRRASKAIESASLPLSGFVWEQDGRIVGNASLVPFRHNGKKLYLIANVATHPECRRKGIARALTEQVMQHARQRGVNDLWLHVRADNPGAVQMYLDLGFVERARRTTWRAVRGSLPSPTNHPASDSTRGLPVPTRVPAVTKRHPRFWPQQLTWLKQLHPDELIWYRSINWNNLKPGLWNWIYRLFVEFDLKQWAVQKDNQLQGVLSWIPSMRGSLLWLACDPGADDESIIMLLRRAQRDLVFRKNIKLEHPAGLQEGVFQAAGFSVARTLIWMHK
jgi:ribosomal protein S18 acetylase RimI-like enzyme